MRHRVADNVANKLRVKTVRNLQGLYGNPPGYFTSASFALLDGVV